MTKALHKTSTSLIAFCLLSATVSMAAENHAFVGARATAMGGANAASVTDATAQWHNPAVFGFMSRAETKAAETNGAPSSTFTTNTSATEYNPLDASTSGMDAASTEQNSPPDEETDPVLNALDNNGLGGKTFGWNILDGGVGYTMTEDMGRYLDILADTDFSSFDTGTLGSDPENVSSLLTLGSALYGIGNGGESLYADYTAGSAIRFGHMGLGLRTFGETAAWVNNLDITNLGLTQNVAAFLGDLNAAAGLDGFAASGTFSTLSLDQRNTLAAKLGVANDASEIEYLDFKLSQLGNNGTLEGADINNAVTLLTELDLDGSGTLDGNETTLIGRAFNVVEVPVSYGRAINDNLSLGVTAKAMYGSVFGTQIWVFNEDNVDEAFENASDNVEESAAIGLDLGLLYRIPNFQVALVGHNLNRPSFDGFTETITIKDEMGNVLATPTIRVPDVKIDPQVTLGAAFMPSERLTLETNYELLETGTILEGYDIQRISFGGEVDVWLLAFRLGAYRNLAASWEDWVGTAGIGVNLFGLRVDIGGAYSLGDKAEYDGNEIPTVARLHAGISLDY